LPSVTCGLYMMFLMGCATLLFSIALPFFGEPPIRLSELGWWNLLVIPIGFAGLFIAAFIGGLILSYVLECSEWIAYCLRKCPKCGFRKWSWGFTCGFGL